MIYIIITTSINNKFGIINNLHRQDRYIECIQQLLRFVENDIRIKPIIVENNGLRKTFLDDLKCDVVYTDNNKLDFKHKGQNELLDIKHVISKYNIQNEDIIIKLTGRYKLLNSSFIELVQNENSFEAFIKFYNVCTKKFMFDDCVLGLFAIKCRFLKNFNYNFKKSPECEFAEYVRTIIKKENLKEIKHLNLECCFANNLQFLIV